jgi:Abnormal spindle-like microcephaly-assoc'd, ASPM-SPD-2-Hydin
VFAIVSLGTLFFPVTSSRSASGGRHVGVTSAIGPLIAVRVDLAFNNVCIGQNSSRILQIFNVGSSPLHISSITRVEGSADLEIVSGPPTPVTVGPNEEIDYMVRFRPTTEGSVKATFQINSNDPFQPAKQLLASGTGTAQTIITSVANSGAFGNVCIGSFKELALTINNPGSCDLNIASIQSTSAEFKMVQAATLVVPAGTSITLPIRFQPTSIGGPKNANITISSNAPGSDNLKVVSVTGSGDPVDIRVTGVTDFGDVCATTTAERTLSICNDAICDLPVTDVSLGNCPDFKLIDNPFPASITRDSCRNLTLRFTPTSAGPKFCTLTIKSADPDTPVIKKDVTANTPAPLLEISPDEVFAPAVVQTSGACRSLQPFPISNKGTCDAVIKSVSIGGVNSIDFSFVGLPSLPIILQPGQSVADAALQMLFTPAAIDRDRHGTLALTYISDPFTGATTTLIRDLCGEGVATGARILVTVEGVPVPFVEKLEVQRVTGDKENPQIGTVDASTNVPLQTIVLGVCGPLKYHKEYGTIGNPIQLSPASYQVTATVLIDGKPKTLTVPFEVASCGFNSTVVVAF